MESACQQKRLLEPPIIQIYLPPQGRIPNIEKNFCPNDIRREHTVYLTMLFTGSQFISRKVRSGGNVENYFI